MDKSWDFLCYYLETEKEINVILLEQHGKDFLDLVYKHNKIAAFQWKYKSNGNIHNILQTHYFPHFFKTIKNFARSKECEKNSPELNQYFNEQFKILETEILLSSSFNYFLVIPTFGVKFPVDEKEFVLDSNHLLKDITEEDVPYGIPSFKETPKSWKQYYSVKVEHVLEVNFSLKKKLSSEQAYERNMTPSYPTSSFGRGDMFNEKLKSVHDFFILFGDKYDPGYFTFGDKYYAKLPPFSQSYDYMTCYTYYGFPPPQRELYLEYPDTIVNPKDWRDVWKNNYNDYYKTFYSYNIQIADVENFRYALEVLVTIRNIPYIHVNNFLLVSTLEGLLFLDSIKIRLRIGGGKKASVAKIFAEVSEVNHEYWQWIFQRNYPLSTPLNSFATKQDLEEFIIASFNYRNNIAHPENRVPVQLIPHYLFPPGSGESEEFILERLISQVFPSFLMFLTRVWVNEKLKTRADWEAYLENLFP